MTYRYYQCKQCVIARKRTILHKLLNNRTTMSSKCKLDG